jgi:hypothetical protein
MYYVPSPLQRVSPYIRISTAAERVVTIKRRPSTYLLGFKERVSCGQLVVGTILESVQFAPRIPAKFEGGVKGRDGSWRLVGNLG